LVITAEYGDQRHQAHPENLYPVALELGVLTALILVISSSLVLLRRRGVKTATAEG
jgi:hypothetical protein